LLLLLLLFFTIAGSTQSVSAVHSGATKVVQGIITTREGKPLVGATVELFDLTGSEVAKTETDSGGRFKVVTDAVAGQYELIITNSGQLNDEQVKLGRTDLTMKVVVSAAGQDGFGQGRFTVSARRLGISPKVRTHIAVAQQRFEHGDLPEAMNELEAAMGNCPSCSEAWSMRAFMKLSAKDFSGAIDDGLHAIALDRNNAEAHLALGTAYNSMMDFSGAEVLLRSSLELHPDSWQAQLELAKTWYGQNRLVLALRQLDLIEHDFPDIHLVRANVLIRLGRKRAGAKEFDAFLREVPGDRRAPQIRQIMAEIARDEAGDPETYSP
jgi:tetratricopeptide (TPR) repeat protein